MVRGWLVIAALGGCVHDNLVACDDGLACPIGSICDLVHGGCVDPAQLDVCAGAVERSPCVAGNVMGACLDGVCLAPRCGNRVVDPGEQCDDGNLVTGDGCDASCTSTETCGNGVTDLVTSEACDDGNLASHDGCDSRCVSEAIMWTVDGIAPTLSDPSSLIYDPVRHETLYLTRSMLWRWIPNVGWRIAGTDAPANLLTSMVAFDLDREKLVVVGALTATSGLYTLDQLWEWNGVTWDHRVITGPWPIGTSPSAAYDSARRELVAVLKRGAAVEAWALDLATARWRPLPAPAQAPSFTYGGLEGVHDVARGRTVFVMNGHRAGPILTPRVYEWDGTAWTVVTQDMHAAQGWTVLYDPSVGAVVALGGHDPITSQSSKWDGATWAPVAPLPVAARSPFVVYDADRQRRVMLGGFTSVPLEVDYESDGVAWIAVPRTAPMRYGARHAFDEARNELIHYGGFLDSLLSGPVSNETWSWRDGVWHQVDSAGIPAIKGAIAYDPIRAATVLTGQDQGTWLLHDDQWTALEPMATGSGHQIMAMAYDPVGRRMIGVGATTTWELPSGGTTWAMLTTSPPGLVGDPSFLETSLAFDARNATMIFGRGSGEVYELIDQAWKRALSPGENFHIVADLRRGSVVFVGDDSIWERVGPTWTELPAPPPSGKWPPLYGSRSAVYSARTGELTMILDDFDQRMLGHRRYVGSNPDETCVAGADTDGDAAAGCDDPDCWPTCAPACPPHVSCI